MMSAGTRAGIGSVALLALAIAGTPAAAQEPPKAALRLGSTPWAPFTDAPGKARFAIDLVHAALQRIGVSVETDIVPEGSLTPALDAGRFHGSPALWRDAEREKRLLYSKPYLENQLVLVARAARRAEARATEAPLLRRPRRASTARPTPRTTAFLCPARSMVSRSSSRAPLTPAGTASSWPG